MNNTKVIEEESVTDNLTVTTSIGYDEVSIYLTVNYMHGKFTIQKSFRNNYMGLEEFEIERNKFRTEEDVKKYFGM